MLAEMLGEFLVDGQIYDGVNVPYCCVQRNIMNGEGTARRWAVMMVREEMTALTLTPHLPPLRPESDHLAA
jgi:hypothetical protein